MAIKYNGRDLVKRIINGREVEKVMYNGVQIRPSSTPVFDNYLQFVANQDYCSIALDREVTPYPSPEIQLEYSRDKFNWSDYSWDGTSGLVISLPRAYDTVYFRNKSATVTAFYRYKFITGRSLQVYGDVTSLLCRYGSLTMPEGCSFEGLFSGCNIVSAPSLPATTLLQSECYRMMFYQCPALLVPPILPATTLSEGCYSNMFSYCVSLTSIPSLPATTLTEDCYSGMFEYCTNIKLSTTQSGIYQTPYRIPSTGQGVSGSGSLDFMFSGTGGTFTGAPSINTTYYTSNTVI